MTPISATGNHGRGVARRSSGFTLLELLVVILILVLLSASLPFAGNRIASAQRDRRALEEFTQTLRSLRREAQRLQQDQTLWLSSTGYQLGDSPTVVAWPEGWAARWEPATRSTEAVGYFPVRRSATLLDPVTPAAPGERTPGPVFYGDGGALAGRVLIESRGQQRHIDIRPLSGRVELSS